MGTFRLTSFLLFTLLILSLILANYYFNPIKFTSHCLSAHASSPTLGEGPIIDCVACVHLDARDLTSSSLVGQIEILMERRNKEDDKSNQQKEEGSLAEKWMFMGHVYGQQGCQAYSCPQMLIPEDFSLTNIDNYKKIRAANISRLSQVSFRREANSFKSLVFTGSPQLYNLKLTSSALVADVSSLLVRFRTNLADKADGSNQPMFLLFSIPTNIFVRLLLLAPLLLELPRLKSLLLGMGVIPGIIMFGALGCSFICQETVFISALISAYLLLGEMLHTRMIAAIYCLLVLGSYLAHVKNIIDLSLLTLVIAGVIPLYFWRKAEHQNHLLHILVLTGSELVMSVVYGWSFLGLCAPIHMLLAIVLATGTHEQEQTNMASRDKYHNVQLEQQEDVMVKIDKMLERT